jgi:hypothetical protein
MVISMGKVYSFSVMAIDMRDTTLMVNLKGKALTLGTTDLYTKEILRMD